MPVRILIVEDHALLSQAVSEALRHDGYDTRRMVRMTRAEVLAEAEDFVPAVVLLDLHLGDEDDNGLSLITPLRAAGASVVMMTGETDRSQLDACLEAGAASVVSKAEPFDHLVAGVREAADLASMVSSEARDDLVQELQDQRKRTI